MLTQAENDRVDNHFESIFRKIISTLGVRKDLDIVSRALLLFLVRVSNTWLSLRTLSKHSPDQQCFMVDAGVLLRCMFDAYLQAEYILVDPAKSVERATSYFEFEHIDRHEQEQRILRLPGPFGDYLRSSPLRAEGQQRNQQEYERVRPMFLRRDGKKTRDKWYEGDLRNLAEKAKKSEEYDLFVYPSHGCVHSSSSALRRPLVTPEMVMNLATKLAARVARLNTNYNRLPLGEEEAINLVTACRGYF
jgi:Family of unknown function (DUF5677)